jgi:4-carboxymuconolactone decarboxylase
MSLRLPARRRLLAELAARAVAPGTPLGPALARARSAGVPSRALAELGLMLHLYAGFPASIEFLRALRESEAAAGRARARSGSPGASHRVASLRSRGVRLCARVYGPKYARLRSFMRDLSPDLDRWMIDGGYGRVLSRPGLGLVERELCTVAALAALGWEKQLDAHRRGATRVGASPAEVRGAERRGRAFAARRA